MILNYMKKWLQYLKWKIGGEKYESHTIPLNGQMPIYISCSVLLSRTLINPSMTSGFKLKLLPRTKGFLNL